MYYDASEFDESTEASGSRSPSDVPLGRPYSPLPDLIIEVEPNCHDHSPESYEKSEIEMKKKFEKLLIDNATYSKNEIKESITSLNKLKRFSESTNVSDEEELSLENLYISKQTSETSDYIEFMSPTKRKKLSQSSADKLTSSDGSSNPTVANRAIFSVIYNEPEETIVDNIKDDFSQ